MLWGHFSAIAPVISARLVMDHSSGIPKAGYVDFGSVAEATATLNALQVSPPPWGGLGCYIE